MLFSLASAACVPSYVEPTQGTDIATVTVDKSQFATGAFGHPNLQIFSAFSDASCSSAGGGRFATMSRYVNTVGIVKVPAGKTIFIQSMFANIHAGDPIANPKPVEKSVGAEEFCRNVTSFVPVAGHQCRVLQTPALAGCSTSISDVDGSTVDFTRLPVSEGCKH
ncbi:MAG TPA: hypothetical protein VK753_05130 [Xanthomonadaceae bacterium]|jgi:hypothetical protein|nr:hypothetical protein [Xanthomonadaceae bacterium]